ncbi:MAG: glycosyltransferase family 4 protein [Flavobacteriales bacterium]|nr:glycosyltransferase family 4 protein [Flavobacteriales bacterium]
MNRPKLVYTTTILASFARNDVSLLARRFDVVVHVFAPKRKWLTPWAVVAQAIFLLRYLPSAAVSVTQFGGFHSWLPVVLGRLFGVPSVISLGGFDCASFPSFHYGAHHRWPMGWFTRTSLRWAAHLVPCSETLILSEQHYSTGAGDPVLQGYKAFDSQNTTPCTVIPYGYDPDRFKPTGNREPASFLTMARMNAPNFQRKGIDLMFAVAERFPECRFTLVGHASTMRYEGVPPNVELLGFVDYEELAIVYARHTYYLQLSIWEGFPSAPCEAMLCGCIPIVSSVAALPKIVGNTGYFLVQRDVEELTRIVSQALSADVGLLSTKARERIMQEYPLSTRNALLHLVLSMVR